MSVRINRFAYVTLTVSDQESEAVKLAALNLKRDLVRTLDCRVNSTADVPKIQIVAGTAGISREIGKKADLGLLKDEKGQYRKEAFLIQEKDGELLIAGTDRRGTVYGIYDFCEWLGVSPWYFFADVPVRERAEAYVETGFCKVDYPSVEYRGIFINDEEELEHWVQRYMGEETIGVKTYEKIFELLLRLKMNYIWPAMHVNSFNAKQENGALADRMGIVVGTSHCDMLMRSNNREWKPWIQKKGYTDAQYDYSMEGRNRDILNEYWQESIEQNKDFEVSYTLGMRGIHDSGMEGRAMKGLAGAKLLQAKKELLELILHNQEEMLSGKPALKTFIPYKEVLELYDNGLRVPEDLTLIWVNDNYGYIRRYPNEQEKKRAGGNGIYYHNSYWAPSGRSYLFICSIPLAHTRNELKKAYAEGIRKIWVTNFGAMKPLEMQMSFYAKLAWEVGREDALTDHEEAFVAQWIDSNFSGSHGEELAPLLLEFDQLTNARKLEQMDEDAFSQTAYGDEAAVRIHRYEKILRKADEIYASLPGQEKDAFFQLVLMKIHAAYFTNCMYYYADRSNLCVGQGKFSAAISYVKKCRDYDLARQKMLYYYNHVMSDGKWNGILTPEDFPPPRTAMYPACKLPLPGVGFTGVDFTENGEGLSEDGLTEESLMEDDLTQESLSGDSLTEDGLSGGRILKDGSAHGKQKLIITVWNEAQEIVFYRNYAICGGRSVLEKGSDKWIELGNAGDGALLVELEGPDWLEIEKKELEIRGEKRVLLRIKPEVFSQTSEGILKVTCRTTGEVRQIPVRLVVREMWIPADPDLSVPHISWEEDGRIVTEAEDAFANNSFAEEDCANASFTDGEKAAAAGWKRIPNLGRDHGALMEAVLPGAKLDYWFFHQSEGCFTLEMHRFPSLNSVGEIRIGVSVDGGPVQVLATPSNDEHKGTWNENVKNNVDKLYLQLPSLSAGLHRISFHAIDRYFAFSRFVIYTARRLENSLALQGGDWRLPENVDILKYADDFYGKIELPPRPALYLSESASRDSLAMEDICLPQSRLGKPVTPAQILEKAREPFARKEGAVPGGTEAVRIDAGAALAQTPNAYTSGADWNYCCGVSHGGTQLAMYLRGSHPVRREDEEVPKLHYRLRLDGGVYHIWMLLYMWGAEHSHFYLEIDGKRIPEKELFGGKPIWRYSSCQAWKWLPAYTCGLEEGEHLLTVGFLSNGLRLDSIYLTLGAGLPPVDAEMD